LERRDDDVITLKAGNETSDIVVGTITGYLIMNDWCSIILLTFINDLCWEIKLVLFDFSGLNFNRFSSLLRLFQKPHVVFVEEADVVDAAADGAFKMAVDDHKAFGKAGVSILQLKVRRATRPVSFHERLQKKALPLRSVLRQSEP